MTCDINVSLVKLLTCLLDCFAVGRVKKSTDEVARQLAAIRQKRNKPDDDGAGGSQVARLQTTLGGNVIADEPAPKRAKRKPKE